MIFIKYVYYSRYLNFRQIHKAVFLSYHKPQVDFKCNSICIYDFLETILLYAKQYHCWKEKV